MDINILNSNFERIAIVDYYKSLMWCKRYYTVGALDIEIEATAEVLEIFQKGYFITRNDDDGIYRIEALELNTDIENGDYLIVGAYDCKNILKQRIIWNTVIFSGTVENYIRKLIMDNVISPTIAERKINNFALKDSHGYTEVIEQQTTYDNLCEKIISVCQTYEYGWKITFENGIFYFDLYKGQDEGVRFSPNFENISNTTYKADWSEYKNVALVGGDGEGIDKKLTSVGDNAGLDRFEMFVNASSISSNIEEYDEVVYYNSLRNEGKERLAETAVSTEFEGEIDWLNTYRYKDDYNLGDIVTIDNGYGVVIKARIIEIIETWDSEGYTLEPKFEY